LRGSSFENEQQESAMTTDEPDVTSGARQTPVAEIVVGLDDGEAAAAAIRWAAGESQQSGLRLRAVHAWQMSAPEAAAATADYWKACSVDARASATRWVQKALADRPQVPWSLDVVEGSAGPVLVDAAQASRLLVVGTREHTGLDRVVHGSVSHYCLSHSQVPVVSVPASGKVPTTAAPIRRPNALSSPGPLL
jgi:nucleotide-binding universal stress UspA family protein